MDFQNTRISASRSPLSYSKVQRVIGSVVRGKKWLQRGAGKKRYLNVGCGPYPHKDFVNLDWWWRPDIELCWDATKQFPLGDETFAGVFSEQCLQDLSMDECRRALREFHRILKPGGIARLILPDAELYINLYHRQKSGETVEFPYAAVNPHLETPLMHVDRAFRNNGEVRSVYDFETLAKFARDIGFSEVVRCAFRQGRDPALLIDSPHRAVESFCAELIK